MLRHLLADMRSSPAPVPWRSDDDGGNAVGEDCTGSRLIRCARNRGIITAKDDVTTDAFPSADDMFAAFRVVFPHMAAAEPERLRSMTSAMINHNDASARNPARMDRAWRNVTHMIGRECNLAAAA
ncbi:MAG: hypothetical protein KDD66_14085 [Bdellovibrionales bacterium]|nr:hypothetical protein [Bdellovibrionales bacterium]